MLANGKDRRTVVVEEAVLLENGKDRRTVVVVEAVRQMMTQS